MTKSFPIMLGSGLFCFLIYLTTGFFIIQPIGAIPEGATIWYWRLGSNMPFIASADGLLLEKMGSVSLFGRAIALGKLSEFLVERKIARFPYGRALYLLSIGGVEFKS